MKFIFADSLDYVDPAFDFIADRSPAERQPYWDDAYPHEILGYAPYDGVLVSKGIVGDHRVKGKYTASQARRFELVGARKFLRLDKPEFAHLDIFGDCGAFTYVNEERPPYSPAEIAEFYDDCGFTHGCSVDHIIFDFDVAAKGLDGGSNDAKDRFEITLENADAFRREAEAIDALFKPLGVVQGWSPDSMAEAARRLVAMGYDYLALGGMVPLKSPEIKQCLAAIRDVVPPATRLHILGFAKADDIDSFHSYDIASFDTTSPLIRAFKDAKQNYYLPGNGLGLRYFTSIRVPQALENPRLQRTVKRGVFRAEDLVTMESAALSSLRAFDRGEAGIEETLQNVLVYSAPLVEEKPFEDCKDATSMVRLATRYRDTLESKPWKQCSCSICEHAAARSIGINAYEARRGADLLVAAAGDPELRTELAKLVRRRWDDRRFSSLLEDARQRVLSCHPMMTQRRVERTAGLLANARFRDMLDQILTEVGDEQSMRGYLRSSLLHGLALRLKSAVAMLGGGDEGRMFAHVRLPLQFGQDADDLITVAEAGSHGDGTIRSAVSQTDKLLQIWSNHQLCGCDNAVEDAMLRVFWSLRSKHDQWRSFNPRDPSALTAISQELRPGADRPLPASISRVLFGTESVGAETFSLYDIAEDVEQARDRTIERMGRIPTDWELASAAVTDAASGASGELGFVDKGYPEFD